MATSELGKSIAVLLTAIGVSLFVANVQAADPNDVAPNASKPKVEEKMGRVGAGSDEGTRGEEQIRMLTRLLHLTEEQKNTISSIIANEGKQIKSLREDKSLTKEQQTEKAKSVHQAVNCEIRKQLTLEQAKIMEDQQAINVAAKALATECLHRLENLYHCKIAITDKYPLKVLLSNSLAYAAVDIALTGYNLSNEEFMVAMEARKVSGEIGLYGKASLEASDELKDELKSLEDKNPNGTKGVLISEDMPLVITESDLKCIAMNPLAVSGKSIVELGKKISFEHCNLNAVNRNADAEGSLICTFENGCTCVVDGTEFIFMNGQWVTSD